MDEEKMNFDEDFPSLEEWCEKDKEEFSWVRVDKFKKYCVDKQRLREAIKNMFVTHKELSKHLMNCIDEHLDLKIPGLSMNFTKPVINISEEDLLKELGL